MILVILHLFLLHPLFNYIKCLRGVTNDKRFTYAMILLSVVSLL